MTNQDFVRLQTQSFNGDMTGFLENCTPHVVLLRNGQCVARDSAAVKHVLRHEQGRRLGRPGLLDGEAVMISWDRQKTHVPTGYVDFAMTGDRVSEVHIHDDPLVLEKLLGIY